MKTEIIIHAGAFGANEYDNLLDSFLRAFAEKHTKDEGEWADKYGVNHKAHNVVMNRFCWCEQDECPYCLALEDHTPSNSEIKEFGIDLKIGSAPNFWYKPLDFKVWWYKYIGRGVEMNRTLTQSEFQQMVTELL